MAKKRLNRNIVVGIMLVFFLSIIVVSTLMLRQLQQRDPKYFIERAVAYEQQEEWNQAAVFYAKAWERGRDPSHLVALGRMLLNEGDVSMALARWRRALIEDPKLVDAHRHLIDVLLELAGFAGGVPAWTAVQEAASKLLEVEQLSTGDRAYAHHAHGLALTNLTAQAEGNQAKGTAELERAATLAPDKPGYAIDLARHYEQIGRSQDAADGFEKLLARFGKRGAAAAAVRRAYASLLAGRQQFDRADRLFNEAVQWAGEDPVALVDAKLGYATFLIQHWALAVRGHSPANGPPQAWFEHAERMLKECMELAPMRFEPYIQLASLYLASGRNEDASTVCDQRLAKRFSRKGLDAARNKVLHFRLRILAAQAAIALAERLESLGDDAGNEQWLDRAHRHVVAAFGEVPRHPQATTQMGRIKLARGQERAALEDFREADAAYRNVGAVDWQNKTILARLHLKLGEVGAAKAVLDEVFARARVERASDPDFWILYGQILFADGELDAALAMGRHTLSLDAENRYAKELVAAVYERKGRVEQAIELIGDSILAALLRHRDLTLGGRVEEGLNVLFEALKTSPADVRLVSTAVGELLKLGRDEQAARTVAEALEKRPDDPALRRLSILARTDLSEQERDQAILELIEAAQDPYQRAWELSDYYLRREKPKQALQYLNQAETHLLARDTPLAREAGSSHHIELLLQKIRLAVELGDESAARQARESASAHNVDGAGGHLMEGLYYALTGDETLAKRALRTALGAQPTSSRAMAYLGQVLLGEGDLDGALAQFERAVDISPSEGLAWRGLAMIAQRRGDEDAYHEALDKCQVLAPSDPWVRAELLARQERADPASAIEQREARLKTNPDDVENLRRLAQLCELAGRIEKADGYHRRILELAPDDRAAIIAASRYFRRTGRPDQSLEIVTAFADSRSDANERAESHIIVAGHHLGEGNLERARQELEKAVEWNETLETVSNLAEFYARNLDDPPAALSWYDKAVALAAEEQSPRLPRLLSTRIACLLHPKVDDPARARECVEELRRLFPEEPRGLVWEAELLAREGDVEAAAQRLTEFLQQAPDNAYVRYQRAQYLLALGRSALAVEDLNHIKRTDPTALDLRPRILLARIFARSGDADAAIRELETLASETPNSELAQEELARAYLRAKRLPDAERIVTTQINLAQGKPAAKWLFLRGQIADRAGEMDKAIADYRRGATAAKYSPESAWIVLDAYLRAERLQEGIAFYRQHLTPRDRAPTVVSHYAVLLARAGRMDDAVRTFQEAMRLATETSIAAVRAVTEDLASAMSVEEGIERFEGLSDQNQQDAVATDRILVRLYRLAGQYDRAAARIEQAVARATTDVQRAGLYHEQGELYQVWNKPEPARRAYEGSLKYAPDNWITLNNLAYLLSDSMGDHAAALPYAQKAVAAADIPDTIDTLGWVYVGLERFSDAVAQLSRAVRLAPDSPLIAYHLGEAYRRGARFLEAGDVLRRAKTLAEAAQEKQTLEQIDAAIKKVTERDTSP